MKSISESMKGFTERSNVERELIELKKKVLSHPDWKAFHQANPEVTIDMINRSLPRLVEFIEGTRDCKGCVDLKSCRNMIKGYEPQLFIKGQIIDVTYTRCPSKVANEEMENLQSLIKSYFIPKDILTATFDQFDKKDQERYQATLKAAEFVKSVSGPEGPAQGLYAHGEFGVGKTFLMGAIANALAKKNIQTILVYTPDFFREMKSSIGDQTVDEKLNVIKKAPVLVLDDIGAETMSSWIRDEVLGSILQYRMMEKLPTCYTSNYDYEELEDHLAYSQKGGIEQLKAKRIMERIKHFTTPISLGGGNRRQR
ncbi:primosomal protein DnaI [Pseudalkalibacillus salsuginis]|uniref:primosomal protein DnaI n=1 Tax=Pseudalkalibacillus salsuginis TaxID=2910972 RepID=UPI001F3E4A5B|nr:primosomal protein DnaI [Pseudalkalibacillus salsuginis]MCF6408732.1 primosomal protein DnaI [Pseudalkalibacillus salsuginis]